MCPSTLHVLGCLPIYLPALDCPCQVQERSRQLERQQSLRVEIEDNLTPRKATIESRLRQTAALTLTLIITLALTLTLTLTAVWLLVPLAPGSCVASGCVPHSRGATRSLIILGHNTRPHICSGEAAAPLLP